MYVYVRYIYVYVYIHIHTHICEIVRVNSLKMKTVPLLKLHTISYSLTILFEALLIVTHFFQLITANMF